MVFSNICFVLFPFLIICLCNISLLFVLAFWIILFVNFHLAYLYMRNSVDEKLVCSEIHIWSILELWIFYYTDKTLALLHQPKLLMNSWRALMSAFDTEFKHSKKSLPYLLRAWQLQKRCDSLQLLPIATYAAIVRLVSVPHPRDLHQTDAMALKIA